MKIREYIQEIKDARAEKDWCEATRLAVRLMTKVLPRKGDYGCHIVTWHDAEIMCWMYKQGVLLGCAAGGKSISKAVVRLMKKERVAQEVFLIDNPKKSRSGKKKGGRRARARRRK